MDRIVIKDDETFASCSLLVYCTCENNCQGNAKYEQTVKLGSDQLQTEQVLNVRLKKGLQCNRFICILFAIKNYLGAEHRVIIAVADQAFTETSPFHGDVGQISKLNVWNTDTQLKLKIRLTHDGTPQDTYTGVQSMIVASKQSKEDVFKSLNMKTKESMKREALHILGYVKDSFSNPNSQYSNIRFSTYKTPDMLDRLPIVYYYMKPHLRTNVAYYINAMLVAKTMFHFLVFKHEKHGKRDAHTPTFNRVKHPFVADTKNESVFKDYFDYQELASHLEKHAKDYGNYNFCNVGILLARVCSLFSLSIPYISDKIINPGHSSKPTEQFFIARETMGDDCEGLTLESVMAYREICSFTRKDIFNDTMRMFFTHDMLELFWVLVLVARSYVMCMCVGSTHNASADVKIDAKNRNKQSHIEGHCYGLLVPHHIFQYWKDDSKKKRDQEPHCPFLNTFGVHEKNKLKVLVVENTSIVFPQILMAKEHVQNHWPDVIRYTNIFSNIPVVKNNTSVFSFDQFNTAENNQFYGKLVSVLAPADEKNGNYNTQYTAGFCNDVHVNNMCTLEDGVDLDVVVNDPYNENIKLYMTYKDGIPATNKDVIDGVTMATCVNPIIKPYNLGDTWKPITVPNIRDLENPRKKFGEDAFLHDRKQTSDIIFRFYIRYSQFHQYMDTYKDALAQIVQAYNSSPQAQSMGQFAGVQHTMQQPDITHYRITEETGISFFTFRANLVNPHAAKSSKFIF